MKYTMNENGFLRDGKVLTDAFTGEIDGVGHLFVNGVSVGTLVELGLREEKYSLGATEMVDPVTGEKTLQAKRPNGDVVVTVLSKDGVLIPAKCKVIKA